MQHVDHSRIFANGIMYFSMAGAQGAVGDPNFLVCT